MLRYTKFTWIETIQNNIIFWIPLILTTPIQSDERLPEVGNSALGRSRTASPFMSDCFCSARVHSNIAPFHSNADVVLAGSCAPIGYDERTAADHFCRLPRHLRTILAVSLLTTSEG
jgi:hypothetical protein